MHKVSRGTLAVGLEVVALIGMNAACDDSFDATVQQISVTPETQVYAWPYYHNLEDKPTGQFKLVRTNDDSGYVPKLQEDGSISLEWESDEDYDAYVRESHPYPVLTGAPINVEDPNTEVRYPVVDRPQDTDDTHYTVDRIIKFAITYGEGGASDRTCESSVGADSFTQAKLDIMRTAETTRYEDKIRANSIVFEAAGGVFRVVCD